MDIGIKRDERTPFLSDIGNRIRVFRLSKDMTQEEFAIIVGVTRQNMSKIERGERGMTEIMICNLINYFADFDANYILVGKTKNLTMTPTEGVEI